MTHRTRLTWQRLLCVYGLGFAVHAGLSAFLHCGVMAWVFSIPSSAVANAATGRSVIGCTVGFPTAWLRTQVTFPGNDAAMGLIALFGVIDCLVFALIYTMAYALIRLGLRRSSE